MPAVRSNAVRATTSGRSCCAADGRSCARHVRHADLWTPAGCGRRHTVSGNGALLAPGVVTRSRPARPRTNGCSVLVEAVYPHPSMAEFELAAPFKPTGDQPQAIERLVAGVKGGQKHQVLLGATGTGKTATLAWVIEQV